MATDMLDGALVLDDQRTECVACRCKRVLRQTASADQENDFFLSGRRWAQSPADAQDPENQPGTRQSRGPDQATAV